MEANEKLEGFLQELVPALDTNTYEKWKGTNFQATISDGNRFNFSSFLLKFTSYRYKRKSATLQHVCSHQVFPLEHILQ